MRRPGNSGGLGLALAALLLAFAIAAFALRTPAAAPIDADAKQFSAARAMTDVREIARQPHPLGSPEHRRVADHLTKRMRALGLQVSLQEASMARRPGRRPVPVRNLIGVLPGRERDGAIVIMAHYDTVAASPGAADDSTGVAAALEAARAIRARGIARRDVYVVLTDAEEAGLLGSRLFFETHPQAKAIGAVVNLEARGSGGRALMFETGPGNAETIALFAKAAGKASGGPSSNSLAVFVYDKMPNGSDFSIARERGLAGVNLAFLGRPGQYHSASDTPERLDQGSVQHIGSLALETADALARAPALPAVGENHVYADIFGLVILRYPTAAGWGALGVAAALIGFAAWRARSAWRRTFVDIGRGMIDVIWFVAASSVLIAVAMIFVRPEGEGLAQYHALLGRLYQIEAAAVAAVMLPVVVLLVGRRRLPPRLAAVGLTMATIGALMADFSAPLLVTGLLAVGLSLARTTAAEAALPGAIGMAAAGLIAGAALQVTAPETALLAAWPLVAAGLVMVCATSLQGPARAAACMVIAGSGAGWVLVQGHFLFLGVGAEFPVLAAPLALLALMVLRPLGANPAAEQLKHP